VKERSPYTLAESVFGLGVVTGDNKTKLLDEKIVGSEPIYTGKEVEKFHLAKVQKYIVFDRSKLQQVAPNEIYRTVPKLVYKTICKELRVALDDSGSLTTNSANILIPVVPGYAAEEVMGLLNTRLYSFLHSRLFGGVNKIAKENLKALPIPELSDAQHEILRTLVSSAIQSGSDWELNQFVESEVFGLSESVSDYLRDE
ncbi:MAG: TaqI-like C-terminal specificity domain-containing protein, partial [Verrucomicrobiota bacterium]